MISVKKESLGISNNNCFFPSKHLPLTSKELLTSNESLFTENKAHFRSSNIADNNSLPTHQEAVDAEKQICKIYRPGSHIADGKIIANRNEFQLTKRIPTGVNFNNMSAVVFTTTSDQKFYVADSIVKLHQLISKGFPTIAFYQMDVSSPGIAVQVDSNELSIKRFQECINTELESESSFSSTSMENLELTSSSEFSFTDEKVVQSNLQLGLRLCNKYSSFAQLPY